MSRQEQHRVAAFLADVELFRGSPDEDVATVYARAADRYDHFRALWLRLAGAGAEEAMLADLRAVLRPGAKVLDAGCGTGVLARRMRELQPEIELTMVDLSAAMLARASDVPGEQLQGSVLNLPFAAGTFDVVVSAWVIETVPEPIRAVSEYLRVLNADGHVLYTFCSLPDGWFSRTGSAWLRNAVHRGFAGQFLHGESTPWHDCERSHLIRFSHGLTTEVALQECCSVGTPLLPHAGS
ncbi:MAG: methyltransferase domain-containing protein [Solirubrobacteraceae bacterium]